MVSKIQMTRFFPTLQCWGSHFHQEGACYRLEADEALGRPRDQVFWLGNTFNHSEMTRIFQIFIWHKCCFRVFGPYLKFKAVFGSDVVPWCISIIYVLHSFMTMFPLKVPCNLWCPLWAAHTRRMGPLTCFCLPKESCKIENSSEEVFRRDNTFSHWQQCPLRLCLASFRRNMHFEKICADPTSIFNTYLCLPRWRTGKYEMYCHCSTKFTLNDQMLWKCKIFTTVLTTSYNWI